MAQESWDFGTILTVRELREAIDSLPEDMKDSPIMYACPIGKTEGVYLTFRKMPDYNVLVINKSEHEL